MTADLGPDTDVPLVLLLRARRKASGLYLVCGLGFFLFTSCWVLAVTTDLLGKRGDGASPAGIAMFLGAVILSFPLPPLVLGAHRYARRRFGIKVSYSRSMGAVWNGTALATALRSFGLPVKLRHVQVTATALFIAAWVWFTARLLFLT